MLSKPETLKWIFSLFVACLSADALAQQKVDATSDSQGARTDKTGGASTTPTLLFIPAGALPAWNVKVVTTLDVQGPTAADRLAIGRSLGFQPSVGGELGLPAGVTLGAGGAIASFTTATWQVACLGGVTTISLDQSRVGGLAQAFAAARF